MNILYKSGDGLYCNLTNRCSSACKFCLRQTNMAVGEVDTLWLEHEPDFDEAVAQFDSFDMSSFKEFVFCGFGEPTMRFDLLIRLAAYVKQNYALPIRLNTNGQGDLINGRHIAPEMAGLIDTLSISLNTSYPEKYNEIVRSVYGDKAFDAMIAFVKEARKYVPEIVLSTVETAITKEDESRCAEICRELNVKYRIREWID
ncbi:MAG: radical SAM protein [Clostridia bacterium]|nr:radical SAM protein [Clostridia bacterium]